MMMVMMMPITITVASAMALFRFDTIMISLALNSLFHFPFWLNLGPRPYVFTKVFLLRASSWPTKVFLLRASSRPYESHGNCFLQFLRLLLGRGGYWVEFW